MNPYLPLLTVLGTALIQITLLSRIPLWGVYPDLVVLVAVSWSLIRGAGEGVVWGFFGGGALDLYSAATPFGVFTLALILVCFATGLGERALFRNNLALPMIAILFATLLYHGIVLVLLQTLGWPVNWSGEWWQVIGPLVGLNTLCMPVVYQLVRTLSRRIGPQQSYGSFGS